MLPKAELHLHLEGAATPKLIKKLAARHNVQLIPELFASETQFNWQTFADSNKFSFLRSYDLASSAIRTAQDYCDVTYEYLANAAQEGVIYAEIMPSPDHAALHGLGYADMLAGVAQGIDDARVHGIEGRIIITCVRHFGVESCIAVAKHTVRHTHPYVVGFGIGGDEAGFPAGLFVDAFRIAYEEAGLACTAHAGEMAGPASIREAIDTLPISRIGHGIRAIEDPDLIEEIIDLEITLECCPTSNIKLGVFPNYAAHPLRKLYDAGVKITLNSDDPPYFGTTIGREYTVAAEHFGFDEAALLDITRTAIENSFADRQTKNRLLEKL